jgi:hypothetical protein
MANRFEKQALEQVVRKLDPLAVGGRAIRAAGLDPRVFDAWPDSHAEPIASACRLVYESLRLMAHADGRLANGQPLITNWILAADIYSPKLERFIEIDEKQHFSMPRLTRLLANRAEPWGPLYAASFWIEVYPRLVKSPKKDLDPPHCDEARILNGRDME